MPKSGSSARPGAAGAGTQAPASGGNPLSPAATEAERFIAARLNQMIRDPRLVRARLAQVEQKISREAQRLEVEKRTMIHDSQGRVRTLSREEKLRVTAINMRLDRLNELDRKARVAAFRIENRAGRR